MTSLLAIDPGYSKSNATGIAQFLNGRLVSVAAFSPKHEDYIERLEAIAAWVYTTPMAHLSETLVIELPKIYPGPQQKGDPDDVVILATLAGMIAGRVPSAKLLLPRPQEWKGNVPKGVMLKRIEKHLEPDERAVLEAAAGKRDALVDATGIGLWALGRLA